MDKRILSVIIIVAIMVAIAAYYFRPLVTKEKLVIATTTSLYDTGLLDAIENEFEAKNSIDLYFISVGTGLAIEHARRGDVDAILIHAPPEEFSLLREGYGVCRKIVAYNFFMIVGPAEDPANIAGLPPMRALTKIAEFGRAGACAWVSRGDESGTHIKEKLLWKSAGFNCETLREEKWYIEAGAGMGKTLLMANEKSAYTLTDAGTYLKYRKENLISLEALVTMGKELLNVYSVIAVNPNAHPEVNFKGAIKFIKFLVSEEGQRIIGEYGKNVYGESLFQPAVKVLKGEADGNIARWIEEMAFLDGAECPPEYWGGHPELYE